MSTQSGCKFHNRPECAERVGSSMDISLMDMIFSVRECDEGGRGGAGEKGV